MHLRTTASGVVVALMVVVPASASLAASPGANGRIAFEQGGVIYSIRADGTDRRQLTAGTDSHSPRWSPDGRWIAFDSAGDIRLMRADGGGMRSITSGAADDVNPSWGPDGDRLVFSRSTDGTAAGRSLYVVSAAGGKAQLLTPRADGCAVEPTWSATGRYVVYWDQCAGGVSGQDSLRKVNTATGTISDVVGSAGLAQPDGMVHFAGTGPDVTPDGLSVAFTASDAAHLCGIAMTDLSGRGFRFLSAPIDCGVFLSDHPAVSPNGKKVVYTAGNERPQLASILTRDTDQCCNTIYASGTNDFPLRPDWQPRP